MRRLWKCLGGSLLVMQTVFLGGSEHFCPKETAYFQKMPKAELHLHLGGSFPVAYLYSIATNEQREQLENQLKLIESKVDYHEGFKVFSLISQIVNTEEKIQKGVEALCQALKEDGVVYVEIRSGLKDLGMGLEAYLKAILRGIEHEATQEFNAKLLLSLQRHSSLEMARATVDLAMQYRDLGIVGIDISGNSTLGQIETIMPELLRAKEAGLSLIVHVGEVPDEKDQIDLLKALQPSRVGHGVFLTPEATDWVVVNNVPLEVCLTSSVLVQMIDHYDKHPGIQLFQQGHPIVFCTDDPLIFSTTLSKELALASRYSGLSLEEITKIVKESFDYKIGN